MFFILLLLLITAASGSTFGWLVALRVAMFFLVVSTLQSFFS